MPKNWYSRNIEIGKKMKINIILIPLLLISSLFGGKNTTKIDVSVLEIPKEYKSFFYVGVGTSYVNLKDIDTNEIFSSLGATLQMGYRYNSFIGVEARYTKSVGDVAYEKGDTSFLSVSNYSTTSSNIALYLKPYYPLGNFEFYGLVGYGVLQYTDLPTGTQDRKESGFQWGLGVDYLLGDNISLFVDYSRIYDGVGLDGYVPNSNIYSDIVTVGVSYLF